jgi:hypothetical protein
VFSNKYFKNWCLSYLKLRRFLMEKYISLFYLSLDNFLIFTEFFLQITVVTELIQAPTSLVANTLLNWILFGLNSFHSIEFFFVPWLIDQTPDCCRNSSSTETTGNKKLIIQNAWLGNDNIINVVEIPPAGW